MIACKEDAVSERPEFANIQDAAERFGISRFKIWRLVKDGQLTIYQSALDRREKLIRLAELEALVTPRPIDRGKARAA